MLWGRVLLVGALGAIQGAPVTIQLSPHVVFAGNAVRLTCRVPRSPQNRYLEYGFTEFAPGSLRQLDGDQALVTWTVTYPRIPCDPGEAYCTLHRTEGSQTVSATLLVEGCEPD